MLLSSNAPIRLDALGHACLSFVDLQYLRLGPEESLFDAGAATARDEAVGYFLTYLRDEGPVREDEVRRALAWVLNLPADRFAVTVRRVGIPVPRFDVEDVRRFLELLWQRAWGDWRVAGFDPNAYNVLE